MPARAAAAAAAGSGLHTQHAVISRRRHYNLVESYASGLLGDDMIRLLSEASRPPAGVSLLRHNCRRPTHTLTHGSGLGERASIAGHGEGDGELQLSSHELLLFPRASPSASLHRDEIGLISSENEIHL